MRIRGFDWDYNNLEHMLRHNVQDHEAEEVLVSRDTIVSKGRNNTYIASGVTENGRYLFVVFYNEVAWGHTSYYCQGNDAQRKT